jgi:putative ribosome biogenesis GTPase RsgA
MNLEDWAGISPSVIVIIFGRIAWSDRDVCGCCRSRHPLGEPSGRLLYAAAAPAELPRAGDWVRFSWAPGDERAVIHEVLPRRSVLSRRAPGGDDVEQIVAANVDAAFIVMGLDHDFNLRRLERYLLMVRHGGVGPVVVLGKADLCEDRQGRLAEVKESPRTLPCWWSAPRRAKAWAG